MRTFYQVSLRDCEGAATGKPVRIRRSALFRSSVKLPALVRARIGTQSARAASDQDRATLEGEPLAIPAEYADSCRGERPRQYPGSLIGRDTEQRDTEQRVRQNTTHGHRGLTLHAGLHVGALRGRIGACCP